MFVLVAILTAALVYFATRYKFSGMEVFLGGFLYSLGFYLFFSSAEVALMVLASSMLAWALIPTPQTVKAERPYDWEVDGI